MIISDIIEILLKIYITGGAGFIGRHLANSFVEKNTVCIYDNLSNSSYQKIIPLIKKGIIFVKGDILDYNTLLKTSKGYDVVIHLAAITDVKKSNSEPEMTNKVNVEGTKNIAEICEKNKINKLIFASSAAVYGNCKELPIIEKMKPEPISPYGLSKLCAENEIKKIIKRSKLNAVCLRFFNVYGLGQNKKYTGVISKFLENISKNKDIIIYGNGMQTRDFISINDVIELFHCILRKKTLKGKIYNIASGKPVSIKNLANILMKLSNKKLKIKYQKENKNDIKFSEADINLAKKNLGFHPKIGLKEGLKKLVSISH